MSIPYLKELLLKINIGYEAGKQFREQYTDFAVREASKTGLPPNSAKATASLVIDIFVKRAQRDATLTEWNDANIKDALRRYIDEQEMLRRLRQSGTLTHLPPSFGKYITAQCRYHAYIQFRKLQESGYGGSDINLDEEAVETVYNILLKNIQDPDFQLKSSLKTYINGISRIVVRAAFQSKAEPAPVAKKNILTFDWDEILPQDSRTKLFSLLENLLERIERNECRDWLLKSFRLFTDITIHERIPADQIPRLKKEVINQINQILGKEEYRRTDKAFQHCYRRFVIESFPMVEKELKNNPSYPLEYIKSEVKKLEEKTAKEKESKRRYKKNRKDKNLYTL